MRVNYQVAIDCSDPHRVARFWAEALRWELEEHEEQIKGLLEGGIATDADVLTIDGRLVWKEAAAVRDPEAKVAFDGRPERGRLLFQQVPESKIGKNRIHLDVHFEAEDRDSEIARLIALGATKLWDGKQGPHTWVTLADPEGNEFCVS